MALNIRCLAIIRVRLLLSTVESEEDASEDVGHWMIQPGQASVLDGETGYENRPPGRPVFTLFYYSPLNFFWAIEKLGLTPIAGVSPKWLFWCRQTIHK